MRPAIGTSSAPGPRACWILVALALGGCVSVDTRLDDDTADDDTADDDTADDDTADDDTADDDTADDDDDTIPTGPLAAAQGAWPFAPPSGAGSVRSITLVWDPVSAATVALYGEVTDVFHTRAVALDAPSDVLRAGPTIPVEMAVVEGQHSLERDLAASDGPNSRLLAVWEDDRLDPGNGHREIYGRFLTVTPGTSTTPPVVAPDGDDFGVTLRPEGEEYLPSLAWDSGAGRFLVAWSDDRYAAAEGGDARRLFARTVDLDGTLGDVVQVGGSSMWQTPCVVVGSGGSGRFLVVWGDYDPVGNALDGGYRARVLSADGQPVTDVLTLVRFGELAWDRPAAAWQPTDGAWRVVWTQPTVLGSSRITFDGAVSAPVVPLFPAPDGAGAPSMAWSEPLGRFVLAWHAWWTTEAFVQGLGPDGALLDGPVPLQAAPPPLGTFWVSVAAEGDQPRAWVGTTVDYAFIAATLLRAE